MQVLPPKNRPVYKLHMEKNMPKFVESSVYHFVSCILNRLPTILIVYSLVFVKERERERYRCRFEKFLSRSKIDSIEKRIVSAFRRFAATYIYFSQLPLNFSNIFNSVCQDCAINYVTHVS